MKISKHARGNYYTTFKGKFIYGSTPEEVEEKYIELRYKASRGHDVKNDPTLEEYMIKWFNAYKKGEGALKTQSMYRNCINKHINPALGKRRVKEITSTDCQELIKSITSSKSLAHKVRITLNQIFKAAVADKIIDFNPVGNTKIVAPDKPKREFLSDDQRELLLEVLQGHRIYPLIYTMLYTGMRQGEALALTWTDVDIENKIICVTKAMEYENSKPRVKPPKTENGIRDIPMSEDLVNFLQERKKKIKSIYVFPGHAGGLMGLTELNRIWRSAKKRIKNWFIGREKTIEKQLKKATEPEIIKELEERLKEAQSFTDDHYFNLTARLLRHTFCTALYDAGIDELTAAKIMGHDVGTMRKIYTHISEHREKATVEKIEALYKTKKQSKKEVASK